MPDGPDWGIGILETIRDPLYDLAELAGRLGYPGVYERGGNTMWFTDFSNGIGEWAREDFFGYAYIASVPSHVNFGSRALKTYVHPLVEYYEFSRFMPVNVPERWGFECLISGHEGVSHIDFVQIIGGSGSGVTTQLYIDFANNNVRIANDAEGEIVVIDDLHVNEDANTPVVFKLVADANEGIYTQLYCNEYIRNLRGHILDHHDITQYGNYRLVVTVYNENGGSGLAWFDYMIITLDEPDKTIEDT
jgi:hypothetical protein